MASFDAFLVVF